MVRPGLFRWGLATLALFAVRPAEAAPIVFTGLVANDFSSSNPNVHTTPVSSNPLLIGQAQWITDKGWISGWAIQDVRTSYNAATDTLSVGIETFTNKNGVKSIFGDADGNGAPGVPDPLMKAAGGLDEASLGGRKSVAVSFSPDGPNGPSSPGTPVVIAGVPADKTTAGPGVDGFTVASYKNVKLGLAYNFGSNLPGNQGVLAFDPDQAHPDLEFTLKNFSKIPGIDPTRGFWISAYAGSPSDVIAGEAALNFTRIPAFAPEGIPEPATVLAWALVAGAAAIRVRTRTPR